jgi:SAM-dependent methyltransferase
MTDTAGPSSPTDPTDPHDPTPAYLHGHAEPVLRSHGWRTVANSAGYLAPLLREGQRLLDVGCGPGSLTADLAAKVMPGRVLAIDPSATAVSATVRACAGLDHVEVRQAGLDEVVATGEHFDIVHAHQVLQHLADPVGALRQLGELCAPAGIVAVRDGDYATFGWFPLIPELQEWLDLYRRVARACGGEPDAGRRLLSWAGQAGLEVVAASASVWCFANPQDRQWWGGSWADRVVESDFARQARDRGLADLGALQRLRRGWLDWASREDGWFLVPHGELLCRGGDVRSRRRA